MTQQNELPYPFSLRMLAYFELKTVLSTLYKWEGITEFLCSDSLIFVSMLFES